MNDATLLWEIHKTRTRVLLTETIHELLVDLSDEKRESLLGSQTIEELVDLCSSIYNNEFDANVSSFGVVGASEIAWQEALGIFVDSSDEE